MLSIKGIEKIVNSAYLGMGMKAGLPFSPKLIPVFALLALEFCALLWFWPDPKTDTGQTVLLSLLAGAFVTMGLAGRALQTHTCNIFFGPEREVYYNLEMGGFDSRYVEKYCGRKAVGSVKLNKGARVYFCDGHSPEKLWMSEWLNKHDVRTNLATLKRFHPSESGTDDDSSPNLPPRFP